MMKMWGDFAKTGNPTPADGAWPAWDSVGQTKLHINQVHLKSKLKHNSSFIFFLTTIHDQDSLTFASDARGECNELWNKWTVFWDIPGD
jgi:hypothetical protein